TNTPCAETATASPTTLAKPLARSAIKPWTLIAKRLSLSALQSISQWIRLPVTEQAGPAGKGGADDEVDQRDERQEDSFVKGWLGGDLGCTSEFNHADDRGERRIFDQGHTLIDQRGHHPGDRQGKLDVNEALKRRQPQA